MNRRTKYQTHRHRQGTILLVVLLVVLLILAMTGSLFQLATLQHRQARRFELQAQADWLARAGADPARQRLAEPNFTGDTWQVELTELGSVNVVSRVVDSPTNATTRQLVTHVTLTPHFLRTPVHGHATRKLGPRQNPDKGTP